MAWHFGARGSRFSRRLQHRPQIRPPADTPPAYKELNVPDSSAAQGWKLAHPSDATLHGNWWEIFNEPELNNLEAEVNASNQTIAQAMANVDQARALVKEARAQ